MISITIDCQGFPKDKSYKSAEVKAFLKKAHNKKCCYCETRMANTVEHFRPKSVYNWLIDDCENLLWACSRCNSAKGAKLPVSEKIAISPDSVADCDAKERLIMFNPARSNSQDWQIGFTPNGIIFSNNPIMQKTIDICNLNHEDLVEARLTLYQQLENEIYAMKKYRLSFEILKEKFIMPFITDKSVEYVAFRKYIIKNYLSDMLKRIIA